MERFLTVGKQAIRVAAQREPKKELMMKISLLGAGSLFFEGVIQEIARTPELHGAEISLHDIDEKRMLLIEQVGKRINEHFKAGLKISSTLERARALDGARAVITSIGVHGYGQQWHKKDVDAVAKFGIMQTTGDSVGPSGISQGLRIIPIFVDIASDMERYCPGCYMLNHSNPMGAICRSVSKTSSVPVIGYCHNVAGGVRTFAKTLEVDKDELDVVVAGVNHMVWLLELRHKGRDVYPEFRKRFLAQEPIATRQFTYELFDLTGLYMVGGDRHIIEFFSHARVPTKPSEIQYEMEWRADMISKNLLSDELTKGASALAKRASGEDPLNIHEETSPEAMGQQIKSLIYGPDKLHVVNLPNRGAVTNLPDWAVIEMKAVVGQQGARPVFVGEMPAVAARWTLAQIYAHELMIDAAIEGSREKAIQALAADPMIRDFNEARAVLDAMVEAQEGRLDRFKAATPR